MTDLTEANFQEVVSESPVPVLVDVWAPWCRPCKVIAPLIARLAGEFVGVATVTKLDADAEPDLCQDLNVSNLPTLLVFVGGVEVDRKVGAGGGYEGIRGFLLPHLPQAAPVAPVPPPVTSPTPPTPDSHLAPLRPPRHLLIRKTQA